MADNVGMEITRPDFEDEFTATARVWPHLWRAAELGCLQAQAYFTGRKHTINPSAASDLQRYEAKEYLKAHGIETEGDISLDALTRNGIGFWYLGRHWRLWKMGSGRELVPRAGESAKKLAFFNHDEEGYQYPLWPDEEPHVAEPSRIVLYEPDKGFNLKQLWFGLPLSADEDSPTRTVWLEPVTFRMITELSTAAEHVEPEPDTDDLPFEVLAPEWDEEQLTNES